MHNTRTWPIGAACETFRTHSLMSKKTIRLGNEGGWSGVGGAYVCGATAAYQLNESLTRSVLAKMPNSRLESLY